MDIVKTALTGKRVKVKLGKLGHHEGVVLGEDKIFKNVVLVGLTKTHTGTVPAKGQKYVSIFRAKPSDLTVV